MRICLRLEYIFDQLHHVKYGEQSWHSSFTVNHIVQLLSIGERPDLKTKLLQLLKQCRQFYSQLKNAPEINIDKLEQVLADLDRHISYLNETEGRIGESLRNCELLYKVKMHTVNPVGVSPYILPEYYLWLQQSPDKRHQDIDRWVCVFDGLETVVRYILELVRQCGVTKEVSAENGFYQDRLEAGVPNQLVSAKVDQSLNVFPEISVGRQRISIHFMQLDSQYFQKSTDAIDFALTFYRLG